MQVVRLAMRTVRFARTALIVLLALLDAVLLREVRDTVANAVYALRQMRFARRHLCFDLLAKGAMIGCRCDPRGAAGRHYGGQNCRRSLALENGARRRCESSTHVCCLLPSC
jgi:hypothetical protein